MYFYKPDDDSIGLNMYLFYMKTTTGVFIIKSFCYTVVLYYTNVVRRPVILQISLQRVRNFFQLCFIELPLYEKKFQ